MADREKVIKGLEHCTSAKYPYPCNGCAYCGNIDYTDPWSCRIAVMRDALELLKEQEPVEPITSGQDDWACGNCGETVGWNELSCSGQDAVKHNYCPNCGKAVRWND